MTLRQFPTKFRGMSLLQSFQKTSDVRLLLLAQLGQLGLNLLYTHAIKLTILMRVVKSPAFECEQKGGRLQFME